MTDFDYHPDLDDLVYNKDLRQKYEEHLFDECVTQAKEKLDYFNYFVNDLNIAKNEAMGVLRITDADLKNYKNLIAIANKREDKTMTTYTLPKEFQDQFDEAYWQQTDDQLDKLVKSESYEDRALAACFGRDKDLDILVHDKSELVRSYVAAKGRGKDLDILVHDSNDNVRWWVADQGRGQDLDILVGDPDWQVRSKVAKQGRGKDLDILVKDPDEYVRQAVAEWGRPQDLDILVHDEDPAVIKTVIYSGRGKDLIYILLNEYDDEVVVYAASMFRRRFGNHTDAYMELFE